MMTVKENTVIVGVSELRTHLEDILEKLKTYCVAIAKRNRIIGVLLSTQRYEEMEELLDAAEDAALGYLAKEREQKRPPKRYLTLEEVEKKIGVTR